MSSESTRQPPCSDGEGPPEAVAELTDAKAMRALAHPVRLSLIDLLGYHEVLTATEASELIGESPSNYAFHLRTLAKYGFLREAAASNRRERPWTLAYPNGVHINPRPADPQATLAAGALIRTMLGRWLSRAGRAGLRLSQQSSRLGEGARLVATARVHDPRRGPGRAGRSECGA
jgi:DNA-binding transcriptional ArsR family regulator